MDVQNGVACRQHFTNMLTYLFTLPVQLPSSCRSRSQPRRTSRRTQTPLIQWIPNHYHLNIPMTTLTTIYVLNGRRCGWMGGYHRAESAGFRRRAAWRDDAAEVHTDKLVSRHLCSVADLPGSTISQPTAVTAR